MLSHAAEQTLNFLKHMPKSKRKGKGQFFTPLETAKFMASMFDMTELKLKCGSRIYVLDPGAGTGILAVALIERLISVCQNIKISLTCYETDRDVLPLLRSNLEYAKEKYPDIIDYKILEEDYIISQSEDFNGNIFACKNSLKYDFIIANPPYLKVSKEHPAALAMSKVVRGAPNLYFLFAAMSLFNLKDNAEMVYIIPRSWTSGAYFEAFRHYLLTCGRIERAHLFISRDKVFNSDEILQEVIIIKLRRTQRTPDNVLITSSGGGDFKILTQLTLPYDNLVSGKNLYVYLPASLEEVDVIKKINRYYLTFPDEGLKMKTGLVVDFRQINKLRQFPGEHVLPLFYSQHIKDGRVNHQSSGNKYDWITDNAPALIQENKNYVFVKRFTSKEEKRRLQCGVYTPSDFKQYKYIATHNKINFIDKIDGGDMDLQTAYGVYALLNSTLFDVYYRILNGSTQVNSSEINNIPVPPLCIIKKIGREIINTKDLSTCSCDRIISEAAYG